MPSVILIETAGVCETVAVEYSVSGSHGPDRLPVSADGFTKGWIGVPPGVPPHEKRTARTTSQQNDRDNHQAPKPIPQQNSDNWTTTGKKALQDLSADRVREKSPGGP